MVFPLRCDGIGGTCRREDQYQFPMLEWMFTHVSPHYWWLFKKSGCSITRVYNLHISPMVPYFTFSPHSRSNISRWHSRRAVGPAPSAGGARAPIADIAPQVGTDLKKQFLRPITPSPLLGVRKIFIFFVRFGVLGRKCLRQSVETFRWRVYLVTLLKEKHLWAAFLSGALAIVIKYDEAPMRLNAGRNDIQKEDVVIRRPV